MTRVFDISAPLERQRAGDGSEVLWMGNCGLTQYPIVVVIKGLSQTKTYRVTREGRCNDPGAVSGFDLHTLPEPLPLIVSYHNVYLGENAGFFVYSTYERAAEAKHEDAIATTKNTFDPNINAATIEVVWRKGDTA
ncbi:hypothetical protein [Glaciimonas sp. PCH181]|uniref:hypothetical protein n=1 Tax=Glaciimonas sp. PCH181 TaxID=2133943 RepID=UPI000D397718|nr:hypothetical protein [Glaciimonas sp. PCH181]PUA19621.1 hypothetical protein C7W93_07185 [Glaciimonas sp. PCH181]